MKAEQFINEYTRSCSNELCSVEDRYGKTVISYHEWVTPGIAIEAVKIAREEVIKKAIEFVLNNFQCDGSGYPLHYKGILYEPKYIAKDIEKYLNNLFEK